MIIFKTIFKTLNKNASSFTITDEAISDNSIFEVYPSDESVILADVTVNGTTANIIFDSAAEYNIPCAIFINNLVGEYSPDLDHIDANKVYYNSLIYGERTIGNVFADLEFEFDSFVLPLSRQINEEVYTNTVPDGVFFHKANGHNIWKKLDASNIDYDSDSTIYSAMGNVDELETESNNLVDAINEVNAKTSGGSAYQIGEHLTNNTWIDGKPIYRNIIPYTTQTNLTAFTWVKTVIPKPDSIDSFMNAYCITNNQALQYFNGWGFIDNMIAINANRNVSLLNGFYLVLEYTKSGASTQSLNSIE